VYSIPLRNVLRLLLVSALAGVGLVAASPGPATAAGVPCQRTFTSDPGDLAVPDVGSEQSVIDLPEDGLVVADVDVSLNLDHPDASALSLRVASRADIGTGAVFGKLYAGQPDDFASGDVNATFDDEASTPITWATPPFVGRFLPFHPLAIHDGRSGGEFVLEVVDSVTGGSGRLLGWSIAVTYRSCDLDADGVEDHGDQCLGLAGRTTSGCPAAARRLTASYRAGKVKGVVSSPVAGCEASRVVAMMRVRKGPDRRVGVTRTRSDGSFRMTRPRKPGRYYATSAALVLPAAAECPAVASRRLRIR
jgi:hypothetical protein